MKKKLTLLAFTLFMFSYQSIAQTNCTKASVQSRLNGGESPISLYNSCNSDTSILYGQQYQGGYIAYLNTDPGQDYGSGFVADLSDFPREALWTNYGSGYQSAGAIQTSIGSGKQNTELIVKKLGAPNPGADIPPFNYAAWISTLNRGGYNDWYLPSLDEMYQVVNNVIKPMANCNIYGYWTSSEITGNYRAAHQVTCGPSDTRRSKNQAYAVRMIRNFKATAEMQTSQSESFASLTLQGSLNLTSGQTIKRLGFCIGESEYPSIQNMQQVPLTNPNSFSIPIRYNESRQGQHAYARSCAVLQEDGQEVSIYGNQIVITYPQVVRTLGASSISAYNANLGGQLVTDTTGKAMGIYITLYVVEGDSSTEVGRAGLDLNGDIASGIFARGLEPNKSYEYMATAYVYSADKSTITQSFNGQKVPFQTPSASLMSSKPNGLTSAMYTTSEMNRVDYPKGTRPVCSDIINKQKVCPSISISGAQYIFLSPNDNSWQIVVAKYVWSQSGNQKPVLNRTATQTWSFYGARYNEGVTLNNSNQTITVTGENIGNTPSTITIQWSTIFQ